MNHNGTGLNQACRALFVNLRFHVSEINTSDWNLLDHRIDTCLTLEDVANGFLKCLKHFIFPWAMYGISGYSTSLPTFTVFRNLYFSSSSGCILAFWSNYGVLFSTSLMTHDVEYFLVCILAIHILSFIRCLFKSFACILIYVLNCVKGVLYVSCVHVICWMCVLWILFPQWWLCYLFY